jgi:hypothetical protein
MNTNKKSKNLSKNQKPIEYDIHLKYRCKKCGQDHWLSFNEASTKNFKVVCDCGKVFGVKLVKQFKLKYEQQINKKTTKVPVDLLDKAVKLLVGYGFTNSEAIELISNSYLQNPNDDFASLVKQTLASIRN